MKSTTPTPEAPWSSFRHREDLPAIPPDGLAHPALVDLVDPVLAPALDAAREVDAVAVTIERLARQADEMARAAGEALTYADEMEPEEVAALAGRQQAATAAATWLRPMAARIRASSRDAEVATLALVMTRSTGEARHIAARIARVRHGVDLAEVAGRCGDSLMISGN